MKKYRVWFIIVGVLVVLIIAISIWAQVALAPIAKKMIEEKGSEALGSPVTVGSLRVSLFPPLTVTAHDVKFSMPKMKLETSLPTLDIDASVGLNIFHPMDSLRSLTIELDDPVWTLTAKHLPSGTGKKSLPAKTGSQDVQTSATEMPNLPLRFIIKRGLVKAFGFDVPVNIDTDVHVEGHKVSVASAKGDIASISIDAKGEQDLQTQAGDWQFDADAKDFKANYKKDDLEIEGPITAVVQMHIKMSAAGIQIEQFNAHADLQKTKIVDGSFFTKPEGTVFGVDIKAQGDTTKFMIDEASLKLASLVLLTKGYVSQKGASDLQLIIERTPLADLEKLSPAFAGSPVGGFIEMKGQIKGEAGNPNALQVNISPFKLEALKSQINWTSADKKSKAEGSVAGDISLAVNGIYDQEKGLEKSSLALSGSVLISSPHLSYKSEAAKKEAEKSEPDSKSQASAEKTTDKSKTPAPEPLLPNWPLAHNANVATSVTIDDFVYNDLKMQSLSWKGKLDQGVLRGNAGIAKIFDGSIKASDVATDLRQAQPDTRVNVKTDQLDVNQALTWASPSWKDLVTGRLSATAAVVAAHPSRADFVARTQAKGSFHLANAVVSTIQLDQLVNQALAKIPGLANKGGFKTNPVKADIKTNYAFNDSVMHLSDFIFITPDKNELRAQGTVDVNKMADLNGTAYLANAPVGGDVRKANSDAQGRLVIPFQLKGSLMSPQVSFAGNTVQDMLKKTAQKELQNLGGKNLNDQINNIKKKGLKGLFGK